MSRPFALKPNQNLICLLLSLAGGLVIATGLLPVGRPLPASANTRYDVGVALGLYPHLAGESLECVLCHTSYGSRTRNAYGSAYDNNGRNAAALIALETVDTDGDGYLNLTEINALTSPGNSGDHPHDDLLASQTYPALDDTRLDSCELCHLSESDPALNSYGTAYHDNGRTVAAFLAIEPVDSDGDGYDNLAELTALTFPGDAGDHPVAENEDMVRAQEKYPAITGTRLDSCDLCHAQGETLNQYGAAYRDNGRTDAAFDAIAAADSDGDGFTNLLEITELTFPGNPADYPVEETEDMAFVLAAYPQLEDTLLETCSLCHTTIPGLNGYGADYLSQGRNPAALSLIETVDSDGDGYLNLDEIHQLTFPGDPGDHPHDNLLVLKKYPYLAGTRLDSCNLCHCSCGELIDYGLDYLAYGRDLAALEAIEALDSDGDGYPNLAEIEALTFPGNASDNPLTQHNHEHLVLEQYPHIAGTHLDECNLCHHEEFSLNPYGYDYEAANYDFTAIETLDSDGDGFINIDEINLLTRPGRSDDYPDDMALALTAYPHLEGTALHSCDLCHAGSADLNPYGQAYWVNGRNPSAFVAIEGLDSDGDSHANWLEIALLTFPGNAVDYPDNMQLALLKYPNLEGTQLHTCHLCHTATWDMNPYGGDFLAYGGDWAAFDCIEALDSDGDGANNLEEINGLALPGDSTSIPMSFRLFLPVILK